MYGGVAGESGRPLPLCRFWAEIEARIRAPQDPATKRRKLGHPARTSIAGAQFIRRVVFQVIVLTNRKSLISGVLFLEVGICFLIDGLQSHLTLGFRSFR
jgi:hypothetical protein